jgi:hypothetical protein
MIAMTVPLNLEAATNMKIERYINDEGSAVALPWITLWCLELA